MGHVADIDVTQKFTAKELAEERADAVTQAVET